VTASAAAFFRSSRHSTFWTEPDATALLTIMSRKTLIIVLVVGVLAAAIAIQYIFNPHPELNLFPGYDPRK
jgi:hypothetical protein